MRNEDIKDRILSNLEELIVYLDSDFKIKWSNKAVQNYFNASPEDLNDQKCYRKWDFTDYCQDCPVVRAKQSKKIEKGIMNKVDGSVWQIKAIPDLDQDGNIKGIIEVALDITERYQAQKNLMKQLDKQEFITETYISFLNQPAEKIEITIKETLASLSNFIDADLSYLVFFSPNNRAIKANYKFFRQDSDFNFELLFSQSQNHLSWWNQKINDGQEIVIKSLAELPDKAEEEKQIFKENSINSLIAVPLLEERKEIAYLSLVNINSELSYSEADIMFLKNIGRVINSALEKKSLDENLYLTQFAVDNADLAIFRVAPQGEIEYVNQRALKLHGYSEKELLGRNIYEIVAADPPPPREQFWQKLKREGSLVFEAYHQLFLCNHLLILSIG
ncbi:PAS domain-containing protein [Fuchsiella alkaliacetigena]|uniref:PAS domain-containing protein n=1 Tax=Fuchsiella alkaliacetigena TaxID=957042 RepID=UPI00200B71C4|nr:PAS domain-containing protein [Fuchsiella alkaliacetigena]MCK8825384.1 PAS domain-containing protein [Fuchsiella alkaliacetigena]